MEGLARGGIAALVAAAAISAPVSGTFALLGGTPKATATLNVRYEPHGEVALDIAQKELPSGKAIVHYDVAMTKLMHLIVISDDFSTFIHVHPVLNAATGHFTIRVPVSATHQYYVYSDTEPKGIGQQVFRFTLPAAQSSEMTVPAGAPANRPVDAGTPSPNVAHAGPYTVKLGETTLAANAMTMLPIRIARNGKPATDLHPYLGAAGHAVFIDTSSLAYVHVHPMLPGGKMKGAGPKMVLHVPGLPVGTYKLWFQFQGGTKVYTVPFTIAAR